MKWYVKEQPLKLTYQALVDKCKFHENPGMTTEHKTLSTIVETTMSSVATVKYIRSHYPSTRGQIHYKTTFNSTQDQDQCDLHSLTPCADRSETQILNMRPQNTFAVTHEDT